MFASLPDVSPRRSEFYRARKEGRFRLPAVSNGVAEVVIKAEGIAVTSNVSGLPTMRAHPPRLSAGRSRRAGATGRDRGGAIAFEQGDTFDFVDRDLKSLPACALLIVREFTKKKGVRLIGVHKRRDGNVIEVDRVFAPLSAIAKSLTVGDVAVWDGVRLREHSETLREVRWRTRFIQREVPPTAASARSGGQSRQGAFSAVYATGRAAAPPRRASPRTATPPAGQRRRLRAHSARL